MNEKLNLEKAIYKSLIKSTIRELKDLRENLLLKIAKSFPDKEITELIIIYKQILTELKIKVNE